MLLDPVDDKADRPELNLKSYQVNDLRFDNQHSMTEAPSSQLPRRMNVPMEDGRLIRTLTEAIGAKHAVEIGTSTGYSGLWFALGLSSTGGKLTTFEIDPDVAATAREIFTSRSHKAGQRRVGYMKP